MSFPPAIDPTKVSPLGIVKNANNAKNAKNNKTTQPKKAGQTQVVPAPQPAVTADGIQDGATAAAVPPTAISVEFNADSIEEDRNQETKEGEAADGATTTTTKAYICNADSIGANTLEGCDNITAEKAKDAMKGLKKTGGRRRRRGGTKRRRKSKRRKSKRRKKSKKSKRRKSRRKSKRRKSRRKKKRRKSKRRR